MVLPSTTLAETLTGGISSDVLTEPIHRSGLMFMEIQWNRLSDSRTELNPAFTRSFTAGPSTFPGSARRFRPIQSKAFGNSAENHSPNRPLYDTTRVG